MAPASVAYTALVAIATVGFGFSPCGAHCLWMFWAEGPAESSAKEGSHAQEKFGTWLRGGTAPDPLVWSAGALHKRRRLVHAVRDRAFWPGPPGIWHSEWFQIPAAVVCADDIALWPYTPGLLVKWVSFLNSLHWPVGDLDLGVGGVSYVELHINYEPWAGERLSLEKAHPRYLVQGAQFQCPGIGIWRSCRFIGALMRSLCLLPGGFGGLSRALLVLIIVDFVTLVGQNVVMVLLLDHLRVLLSFSWMSS